MPNLISATHSIDLAPAHVRAQTHLLIARIHFQEALAADQRRADEIQAGRDVAALDHIEVANRKTTQAALSLGHMLKADAASSLKLGDPMWLLLDLVKAAHAGLRITQYGMWNKVAFEDKPDIGASQTRVAASA